MSAPEPQERIEACAREIDQHYLRLGEFSVAEDHAATVATLQKYFCTAAPAETRARCTGCGWEGPTPKLTDTGYANCPGCGRLNGWLWSAAPAETLPVAEEPYTWAVERDGKPWETYGPEGIKNPRAAAEAEAAYWDGRLLHDAQQRAHTATAFPLYRTPPAATTQNGEARFGWGVEYRASADGEWWKDSTLWETEDGAEQRARKIASTGSWSEARPVRLFRAALSGSPAATDDTDAIFRALKAKADAMPTMPLSEALEGLDLSGLFGDPPAATPAEMEEAITRAAQSVATDGFDTLTFRAKLRAILERRTKGSE